MDLFLFSLGRGVGKKFDLLSENSEFETVEWNGEVCQRLVGYGEYLSGNGTWDICVSPDASFMIRRAKYTRDDEVLVEIQTDGLNHQNDCVYPDKSTIRILPKDEGIVHEFIFTDAKLEFDTKLFDLVTREFDGDLPDGSLKMDSSSGKDTIQVIGGAEPREPYLLEPRSLGRRFLFIAVVNVLGIALLLYLIRRDLRRKREQDTNSPK